MAGEILNLTVNGMSCSHCENSIRKSVRELKGVNDVKVDLKTKKVIVEYDPKKADLKTIRDVIEDQGYDVE
jgi:copper ion binding protein